MTEEEAKERLENSPLKKIQLAEGDAVKNIPEDESKSYPCCTD